MGVIQNDVSYRDKDDIDTLEFNYKTTSINDETDQLNEDNRDSNPLL